MKPLQDRRKYPLVLIVLVEFLRTTADDFKAALLPWSLACRDVPMDRALNVPIDGRTLLDCVDGEPDSLGDVCDSRMFPVFL